jgi:hypothetical protein
MREVDVSSQCAGTIKLPFRKRSGTSVLDVGGNGNLVRGQPGLLAVYRQLMKRADFGDRATETVRGPVCRAEAVLILPSA